MEGGFEVAHRRKYAFQFEFAQMTQLLTTREASDVLHIPIGTLRSWRFLGKGPPWVKIEGAVRYDAAELQKYIDENRCLPSVRARSEELIGSL